MPNNSLTDLHGLIWTALMAALVAAGAYLIVPIGPVPVSLQPLFVFLAGYALGPRRGPLAMGLYMLAGLLGLPVFAGGGAGLGHVFGPTGGYLFGFLAASWLCGLARTSTLGFTWSSGLAFGGGALLTLYAMGAVWLKFVLSISWTKAWLAGVVPFIPWDGLKVVAALFCARHLHRFGLLPGQR
ncbi:biotin transporter BioY [Pseudodesulfovibrio sp.]|uniref:biotin transporter BioY n=1 Tax=Pseudodesulfovibrio sp. TaxID=2035812 RepID=UPI00262EA216|nr:biotin transporter BioY [Pseudodesulfovibrio sp.]MDD3312908.1 biotin transporter BioY [Pseudodesulfovibrio sp.]